MGKSKGRPPCNTATDSAGRDYENLFRAQSGFAKESTAHHHLILHPVRCKCDIDSDPGPGKVQPTMFYRLATIAIVAMLVPFGLASLASADPDTANAGARRHGSVGRTSRLHVTGRLDFDGYRIRRDPAGGQSTNHRDLIARVS